MRVRTLPLQCAVLVTSLTLGTDAAAQGRGRPKGPWTTTPSSTQTATGGVTSFRQFGSWLDDASAPTPHQGRAGIGVGYWRLSEASQLNAPMIDVGYGITDRFQVSAAVPFYRASVAGTTYRGLDDMYVSGKYSVIDPALSESEFGLAVSPVVEILSAGSPDGRLHVGFPVSVELRRLPFRVYGSAGYFSRGSVFAGGAVEWSSPSGIVFTGALTQSSSLNDDATLDAAAVGRQRVDLMGGAAYPFGPAAAAYVSIGRSLTSIDEGGTIVSVAAGVSFRFGTVRSTP